jgi:hypothetical protein
MKKFRVTYKGEVVRDNLTYDETADALHELALKYYDNEKINPDDIQMEEID